MPGSRLMSGKSRPTHSIRVLLVEDHALTRQGLTDQLNAQSDITVVSAVATVPLAIAAAAEHHPDVAVIDLQLPEGDAVELCQRLARVSPDTRRIIHTRTEADGEPAVRAVADAVVLKRLSGTELAATIHRVTATDHPHDE